VKTWVTGWLVAGVVVNGLQVLASWYSVWSHGSEMGMWYALILVFPIMLALLLLPIFGLAAVFRRVRRMALYGVTAAIVWVLTGLAAGSLAETVRMSGMRRLAERSMIVVHAIERYEAECGTPPNRLDELVPKYLNVVPKTGLDAYPEYELMTGSAAAYYENNPWVLLVSTSSGGINFDVLAYFPRQNYPAVGQSGWWEPVGMWAYLHE
jgi:hypothetical protein